MEEDIKRIECLIERCKQCKLNACITCDICWSEVQAIENIVKRYKELEEENKQLQAFGDFYMKNDYIPISVIQNKKDKLKEVLDFVKTDKSEFSKGQASVLERIIKMFENEILGERSR